MQLDGFNGVVISMSVRSVFVQLALDYSWGGGGPGNREHTQKYRNTELHFSQQLYTGHTLSNHTTGAPSVLSS